MENRMGVAGSGQCSGQARAGASRQEPRTGSGSSKLRGPYLSCSGWPRPPWDTEDGCPLGCTWVSSLLVLCSDWEVGLRTPNKVALAY